MKNLYQVLQKLMACYTYTLDKWHWPEHSPKPEHFFKYTELRSHDEELEVCIFPLATFE